MNGSSAQNTYLRERSAQVVPLEKLQVGIVLDRDRGQQRRVPRASSPSPRRQGMFVLLTQQVICGLLQPLGDKVQGICEKQAAVSTLPLSGTLLGFY